MPGKTEIRDFLTSRRARLRPEDVGLESYGRRRVPGLRREEVARLAEISDSYYAKLERGSVGRISEGVLQSIVSALRLGERDEAQLRVLISSDDGPVPRRRRRSDHPAIRPSVQRMIDGMGDLPVLVVNGRLDVLATNTLARFLFAELFDTRQPSNIARFVYLDPRARWFALEWERIADDVTAALRTEVARDPYDRQLSDLVGELSTRSEEFRVRLARPSVAAHCKRSRRLHHADVGDLSLDVEVATLESDSPLTMVVFSAPDHSASHDGLTLLGTLAAASEQASESVDAVRR